MSAGPYSAFATPDLFGPSTGAAPGTALALKSGDPLYQQAITTQSMKNLQPAYKAAMASAQQDLANRGLNNSGVSAATTQGLQQGYLGQVGNIATEAATKGADVALENKRITQQYAQQTALQQQEIAAQKELQQNQFNNSQNQAGQSALLGAGEKVGAGLIGGYLGGPVGASLLTGAVGAAQGGGGAGQPAIDGPSDALLGVPGASQPGAGQAGFNGTPGAPGRTSTLDSYLRALSGAGYNPSALQQLGSAGSPYGNMGGYLALQGLY